MSNAVRFNALSTAWVLAKPTSNQLSSLRTRFWGARISSSISRKFLQPDRASEIAGGVSKSMLKQSRLNFDKIEKCE